MRDIEYKVTFIYPDGSIGARHFATLEEAEEVARLDGGTVSKVRWEGQKEITIEAHDPHFHHD